MKNLTERAMQGLPDIRRKLGLETDMQRDMRLMQQGDVMGQTLSQGLPAPIANLSAGILRNIPGITDNVRQLGVQSGMSGLQTESELFERALAGYDGTKEGQARVVQSLTAINPEMGAMMARRMQKENNEFELQNLQMENVQGQIDARNNAQELAESEALAKQTLIENKRLSLNKFIDLAGLEPQEVAAFKSAVNSGDFDGEGALKSLLPLIDTTDELKVVGNAVKNMTTGEWDMPPSMNSEGELLIDVSSKDFDPSSIARYRAAYSAATNPDEKVQAANLLLPIEAGYSYVQVPRVINGEEKQVYVNIPSTGKAIGEARTELAAVNSRNRTLNRQANSALTKTRSIRNQVESGEASVGSATDILFTFVPGSEQWTLSASIDTVKAVLGITALADARNGYATGASGFGQLTEKELKVLTNQIAALEIGMNQTDFLENLSLIEDAMQEAADRSAIELEYNQFIGLEELPEVVRAEDF